MGGGLWLEIVARVWDRDRARAGVREWVRVKVGSGIGKNIKSFVNNYFILSRISMLLYDKKFKKDKFT
jgi:hypothetical protein